MNRSKNTYVVGGLGTSRESLEMICDTIEPWFQSAPIPVRLLDATRHYDDFVADTRDQSIVAYSAATTLFDNIHPRELLAVAPATGFEWRTIATRALKAARALSRATEAASESLELHAPFARETTRDLVRHAFSQYTILRRIARYDTVASVERLVSDDVSVALALMEDDPMFFDAIKGAGLEESEHLRLISVPGGHNEFSLRPAAVYESIVKRLDDSSDNV